MGEFKNFTIDDIKESWEMVNKCLNSNNCDNFLAMLLIKSKYEPLYNELINNWDINNANNFMTNLFLDVYNARTNQ